MKLCGVQLIVPPLDAAVFSASMTDSEISAASLDLDFRVSVPVTLELGILFDRCG